VDELDNKIIAEMQYNPRQSNRNLSKILSIDEATVRRRVDNLVSSGSLILTVLPDLTRLGYPIYAHFIIGADHSRIDVIGQQLFNLPELRFVATCAGPADFSVRGNFATLETMMAFNTNAIGKIEGISSIETMIECRQLKSTHNRIGISSNYKKPVPGRTVTISESDRRLILQLQKDARTPLKELAETIGVSNATVSRRIKELVGAGVIELAAVPDNAKVGFPVRCSVRIATEPSKVNEVADSIAVYPQVSYLALISGPVQILAGMHLTSADELSWFVENVLNKIDGTRKIEPLIYLKILKREFSWLSG